MGKRTQHKGQILFIALFFLYIIHLSESAEPKNEAVTDSNVVLPLQQVTEAPGARISKTCYLPKGRTSCAPHYIISGAVKSGTNVLYDYLSNHPKVLPLNSSATLNGKPVISNKEVRFWMEPNYLTLVEKKGELAAFHEYLDLFYPISVSDPYFHTKEKEYVDYITGEASPMYINQFGVANRIFKFLPEVKIIVMLRDPIDRAYSEYWFKESIRSGTKDKELMKEKIQKCLLYEKDLFASCSVNSYTYSTINSPDDLFHCVSSFHRRINAGEPPSEICPINNIKFSLYPIFLAEWVKTFGDNLLVISSEDFFDQPAHWMEIVAHFLGIDDEIELEWNNILGDMNHTSDYPEMDDYFRNEMEEFFVPIKKMLAILLKEHI